MLVSRKGYEKEIAWRKERNKDLAKECQFSIPEWESLELYYKDGDYQ